MIAMVLAGVLTTYNPAERPGQICAKTGSGKWGR